MHFTSGEDGMRKNGDSFTGVYFGVFLRGVFPTGVYFCFLAINYYAFHLRRG
jgi:hypothetical protein